VFPSKCCEQSASRDGRWPLHLICATTIPCTDGTLFFFFSCSIVCNLIAFVDTHTSFQISRNRPLQVPLYSFWVVHFATAIVQHCLRSEEEGGTRSPNDHPIDPTSCFKMVSYLWRLRELCLGSKVDHIVKRRAIGSGEDLVKLFRRN